MRRGGLLIVAAHPDDEVLIAGGTLAAAAAAGLPTAVVCLTRGEHGPISDSKLATRRTLPAVRLGELQAACGELGVEWVECHRHEDGNLRWSDGSAIIRGLTRILQRLEPRAVITFGEDGLYYHPDHIATYRFTRRAVGHHGDTTLYRSVWPSDLMPELVQELEHSGLPAGLWGLEPDRFGIGEPEGVFELDLRVYARQKLRALRCHQTQLGGEHAFSGLPEELAERYLGIERFAQVGASDDPGWLHRVMKGAGVDA